MSTVFTEEEKQRRLAEMEAYLEEFAKVENEQASKVDPAEAKRLRKNEVQRAWHARNRERINAEVRVKSAEAKLKKGLEDLAKERAEFEKEKAILLKLREAVLGVI